MVRIENDGEVSVDKWDVVYDTNVFISFLLNNIKGKRRKKKRVFREKN